MPARQSRSSQPAPPAAETADLHLSRSERGSPKSIVPPESVDISWKRSGPSSVRATSGGMSYGGVGSGASVATTSCAATATNAPATTIPALHRRRMGEMVRDIAGRVVPQFLSPGGAPQQQPRATLGADG